MPYEKFKYYALKISGICIIIFILQIIFSGFTDLFLLLGLQSFEQPWRLVTSIFLHGSATHLLFNLFALVLFGSILEKVIGSRRFLLVFFITGIFASILSAFFYEAALGASGAIMGLIGCLTILRPKMIVWAFGMPLPLFIAAILWAFADLGGFFAIVQDNTANIAHLAGLGFGLIIGTFLRNNFKIEKTKRKTKVPEKVIRVWETKYMN